MRHAMFSAGLGQKQSRSKENLEDVSRVSNRFEYIEMILYYKKRV